MHADAGAWLHGPAPSGVRWERARLRPSDVVAVAVAVAVARVRELVAGLPVCLCLAEAREGSSDRDVTAGGNCPVGVGAASGVQHSTAACCGAGGL